MHHMDADKEYREKAWQQLYRNATSYIEQILDDTDCISHSTNTLGKGMNPMIRTFPKGISAMWNEISLVQDLNSCRCVHSLRR